MNGRLCEFSKKAASASVLGAVALAGACLAGAAAADTPAPAKPAADSKPPEPAGIPHELIVRAEQPMPYPTFASIPPMPKDLPTPAQFRTQVVTTRLAGARLTRQAGQIEWTLTDVEPWERTAQAAAIAPPQITDTAPVDAIAAQVRARASAPPRSR